MKHIIKGFFFAVLVIIELIISAIAIIAMIVWNFKIPKKQIKTLVRRILLEEDFIVIDIFRND